MIKILFICTHNRCRSILAEAITNHYGQGLFVAKSAGSQPIGEVHPLSIHFLSQAGISTDGLCSQSWDEHESWQPDIVITVCDSAAAEPCPVWFGRAMQIHWGLVDPSRVKGCDKEIANSFNQTIKIITKRIQHWVNLDINTDKPNHLLSEDRATIKAIVEQLGKE